MPPRRRTGQAGGLTATILSRRRSAAQRGDISNASRQQHGHCLTSGRRLTDRTCPMKRDRLLLASVVALSIAVPAAGMLAQAQAPTPAPANPPAAGTQAPAPEGGRGGGRGGARGRGQQTPPPPPLTCSSKATDTDNKVPAALARDGFVSIFNGKDLTGWQALIDLENGSRKFAAGLNRAEPALVGPS